MTLEEGPMDVVHVAMLHNLVSSIDNRRCWGGLRILFCGVFRISILLVLVTSACQHFLLHVRRHRPRCEFVF